MTWDLLVRNEIKLIKQLISMSLMIAFLIQF